MYRLFTTDPGFKCNIASTACLMNQTWKAYWSQEMGGNVVLGKLCHWVTAASGLSGADAPISTSESGNEFTLLLQDNVIKWKHLPRYWPFLWGIHRSPVNSPHNGQWHGALIFYLICAWIKAWVNNIEAGDLRRHRTHYDVIVMGSHCLVGNCDVLAIFPISFRIISVAQTHLRVPKYLWHNAEDYG